MNPKISITVDSSNKAIATITGIASVGAKVDVELHGMPSGIPDWLSTSDWTGPSIRFRIINDSGEDIVRFPLEKKTSTEVTGGDRWTTATSGSETYYTSDTGSSGSPVVNFNTEELIAEFDGEPYNTTKSFGLIIDSAVDYAEYAIGKIKINQWLEPSIDDPTSIPGGEELVARINAASATVTKSGDTATISITDTRGVTTTATVKDGKDGTVTDVQVDSTSVVSGGVANVVTTNMVKKTGETTQSVSGELIVGDLNVVGGTKFAIVSSASEATASDTLYFITGS